MTRSLAGTVAMVIMVTACGSDHAAKRLDDAAVDAGKLDCTLVEANDPSSIVTWKTPRACEDVAPGLPCGCPTGFIGDAGSNDPACKVSTSAYAQGCQSDSDCVLAADADFCGPSDSKLASLCQFVCPAAAITTKNQSKYLEALSKVPYSWPPSACACPLAGDPACVHGACTVEFRQSPSTDGGA